MTKYKYIICFLGLFFVIILSCDKIEEPFIEYNGQCGDASLPVPIKQILIEEYTGHECGNCPRGDEEMELLKSLYCDHIIPVSIHAGFFADVNSSGKYTYDYRTQTGNELDEYFNASVSVPAALINRKQTGGDYTYSYTQWAGIVEEMLQEKPVMDINLELSYNISSREMTADIDVVFIASMNENLMLSVYFVEDSLKSWQKDYSLPTGQQDIEFYSHNHVLRDAVNSVWGESIVNGQVDANDVKSKTYDYTINSEWVIENSSVVAFVYKSDTKEILQATQEYFVP